MGIAPLTQIQVGKESSWGGAVAAAARWMGLSDACRFTPIARNTQRRYLRPNLAPTHRAHQTYRSAQLTVAGDLNTSDILYVLMSGMRGGISPTGAGNAKTWAYDAQMTASPAVESRTIEWSDGQQEYEAPGCICSQFEISANNAEDSMVQFSSTWLGKDWSQSTITGALSDRAVNYLPGLGTKLYVNDIGGTIGSTELTATLVSWTYTFGMVTLKRRQSGAITPAGVSYLVPTCTLNMRIEHDTAGATELAKYLANTGRLIRLKNELGAAISGGGNHTLQLDFAGDVVEDIALADTEDGDTVIDVSMAARYDTGAFASFTKATVINELAAIVG